MSDVEKDPNALHTIVSSQAAASDGLQVSQASQASRGPYGNRGITRRPSHAEDDGEDYTRYSPGGLPSSHAEDDGEDYTRYSPGGPPCVPEAAALAHNSHSSNDEDIHMPSPSPSPSLRPPAPGPRHYNSDDYNEILRMRADNVFLVKQLAFERENVRAIKASAQNQHEANQRLVGLMQEKSTHFANAITGGHAEWEK